MAEVMEAGVQTPEKTGGTPGPEMEKQKKPRKKMSNKNKRIIRLLIVAAVVLVGVVLLVRFLKSGSEEESQVVEDTVQYGSITSTVEGSGLTRAKDSKTITLTTAGTVTEVMVTEGQPVKAGDPLYSIDSPTASTAVKKAKSDVEGYQKQISALQKDIAGLNLAAGYSGKLTDVVTLNPGDTISKCTKVATLSDDTRFRLKQYYSYAYKGEITAGQAVSVSIPALMTTLTGKVEAVHMVTRITPEGSKLFEADILINNPGTLTADMVASGILTVNGETVYPYESAKLEYYRTGDLKSTVDGTVISSSLLNYLQVSAGQVLLRINGDDTESQMFSLEQSLAEAQKTLDTAQENLNNCSATAPIDGTVIGLALVTGDEVAANTAVITIANTSTILIDATVDERNISYVQAGMPVDITDWNGNTYAGTVETVSLSSKVNNGVASYPMVISVDNSDGSLMNGSNVNYSMVASQNDNCLVLPIQSVKYVQMDDGSTGTVVFVKSEKRPDGAIDLTTPVDGVPEGYGPVPVEIGISDDYNVELKSGVEEGTVVFTQVQTTSSWG